MSDLKLSDVGDLVRKSTVRAAQRATVKKNDKGVDILHASGKPRSLREFFTRNRAGRARKALAVMIFDELNAAHKAKDQTKIELLNEVAELLKARINDPKRSETLKARDILSITEPLYRRRTGDAGG